MSKITRSDILAEVTATLTSSAHKHILEHMASIEGKYPEKLAGIQVCGIWVNKGDYYCGSGYIYQAVLRLPATKNSCACDITLANYEKANLAKVAIKAIGKIYSIDVKFFDWRR